MNIRSFRSMGTDIIVIGPAHASFDRAAKRVQARFAAEDKRFSRFRGESELTAVNRRAGERTAISPPFAEVLGLALGASARTDGLFDPTVHDALVAAGYDRDFDDVLAGARGTLHPATPCGRWTEIVAEPDSVVLPPGVHLDLGGIAKGWCVDRAAEDAIGAGLPWVLVNAGGDLRLLGDAPPVDVDIEDPEVPAAELLRVTLRSGALATSSVCKRAWGPDAHHVIDPRTGAPARTNVLQATVWAPTCADAEIDATQALLLGTDAVHLFPATLVTRDGEILVSMRQEEATAA